MGKYPSFFYTMLMAAVFFCQIGSAQDQANKLDDNGKKHGAWKGYFDESKRVKYEGNFDHGKETGIFTFYDDTKAHSVIATRDFTKGENSAYTIFYDQKKNKVSEGNIVNKQYEGEWKYYQEASPVIMSVENYKKGQLDGKRSVFYKSGKPAEETMYKAGKKDGPYKKYAENGIVLEEESFANDLIEGMSINRDPDGSIVSKGNYVKGEKKGTWEFYEKGKPVKKVKYPVKAKFVKKKDRKTK